MSAMPAIYVGCKQLGIEEDDRRDLFERVTGKRSLREMNPKELDTVVSELRSKGFKQVSKGSRSKLQGPFAKKMQALWIAAYNLGLIRNKNDDALMAFIKRQTKLDHSRFLRYAEDADKAIEALKGWMAREANVDWSVGQMTPDYARRKGYKIASAQWDLLPVDHSEKTRFHFLGFVKSVSHKHNIAEFTEPDWIPVMNKLGVLVRDAK